MHDETNARQDDARELSLQEFSSEGIPLDVARLLERRGRPDSRSYLLESDASIPADPQSVAVQDRTVRTKRFEEAARDSRVPLRR